MNLRSGLPYWRALGTSPPTFAPLAGDATCEVAVLGGGVTGALTARLLVKAGVDVMLIDKHQPATGSTAASTGLLQYEVDRHLVDLIKLVGEAKAVHAYRRGLRAIDELEHVIAGSGDDCGFARRRSLYFATHWWDRRRLQSEFDCRRQYGFDVRLLNRDDLRAISSIKSAAAIESQGDAEIDPFRLTCGLLRSASSDGARIFARTEIDNIEQDENGVTLSGSSCRIRAKKVVFATGYESQQHLRQSLGNLNCTYATVSQPLECFDGWPEGALIWETARPYFYARQTADGRAMIGGGDTAFANDHRRDALVEKKVQRLKRRFERLFPALRFEPEFSWAGTFGESQDGLAYIGSPPDQPHAYFAVGYGGNGITFSMIAARLITDLYLGKPNPDREVFGFER